MESTKTRNEGACVASSDNILMLQDIRICPSRQFSEAADFCIAVLFWEFLEVFYENLLFQLIKADSLGPEYSYIV